MRDENGDFALDENGNHIEVEPGATVGAPYDHVFQDRVVFEDGCDPWVALKACFGDGHAFGVTYIAAAATDLPINQNDETSQGIARQADILGVRGFAFENPGIPAGITVPGLDKSLRIEALEANDIYDVANQPVVTAPFNVAAVNMSWNFSNEPYLSYCTNSSLAAQVSDLKNAGIAVVTAAGKADDTPTGFGFPGCLPGTIVVGAATYDGTAERRDLNGNLQGIDLLAPGEGLSDSLPYVAAAFALLKQAHANASVDEIRDALIDTGTPVTSSVIQECEVLPDGSKECEFVSVGAITDPAQQRPLIDIYAAHLYLERQENGAVVVLPQSDGSYAVVSTNPTQ